MVPLMIPFFGETYPKRAGVRVLYENKYIVLLSWIGAAVYILLFITKCGKDDDMNSLSVIYKVMLKANIERLELKKAHYKI